MSHLIYSIILSHMKITLIWVRGKKVMNMVYL